MTVLDGRAPRSVVLGSAPSRSSVAFRKADRNKRVVPRDALALPRGSTHDRRWMVALRAPWSWAPPRSRSSVAFRNDGKACRSETLRTPERLHP